MKKIVLSSLLMIAMACSAPKGDVGPKGQTGATGDAGAAGQNGPQGVKGAAGATGLQGPQGSKGDTGTTGAYTGYSTGWQVADWTLASDVTSGGRRTLKYSFVYTNDKITEQMLLNSIYQVMANSTVKNIQTKLSNINLTYRKVGSQNYTINMEPNVGKIIFNITSSSTSSPTESATAIRDSLNNDKINVHFSSIF